MNRFTGTLLLDFGIGGRIWVASRLPGKCSGSAKRRITSAAAWSSQPARLLTVPLCRGRCGRSCRPGAIRRRARQSAASSATSSMKAAARRPRHPCPLRCAVPRGAARRRRPGLEGGDLLGGRASVFDLEARMNEQVESGELVEFDVTFCGNIYGRAPCLAALEGEFLAGVSYAFLGTIFDFAVTGATFVPGADAATLTQTSSDPMLYTSVAGISGATDYIIRLDMSASPTAPPATGGRGLLRDPERARAFRLLHKGFPEITLAQGRQLIGSTCRRSRPAARTG